MKITYEVQEMGVWFVLLVEMKGGRREQTEQHKIDKKGSVSNVRAPGSLCNINNINCNVRV